MQQDRRNVIAGGLAAIAGFSAMPLQAQKPPKDAPVVLPPVQVTLLEQIKTATEETMTMQSLGSNGVTAIGKFYGTRTEKGDSYKVVVTTGISWWPQGIPTSEPTEWQSLSTTIIDGVKGEVDGDYRNDKITQTVIFGAGTIVHGEPKIVRVRTIDPLASMSIQEFVDSLIAAKKFKGGN